MGVVVERGTRTGLLQSHFEWRENSGLISVYILVTGINLKGICDVLLLDLFDINLHTRRPLPLSELYCNGSVCNSSLSHQSTSNVAS